MPFISSPMTVGGDVSGETQESIYETLKNIDQHVQRIAREKGLENVQVKILQPLNVCVLVTDQTIFVIATTENVGGLPRHQFSDESGKVMNLSSAIRYAERKLAMRDPFGLEFP